MDVAELADLFGLEEARRRPHLALLRRVKVRVRIRVRIRVRVRGGVRVKVRVSVMG